MADDQDKLYDNPRSKTKWKKGDRRMIDGVEHESAGSVDEMTDEDRPKPPALIRDRHFWIPVEKPEGKPTS